MWGGETHVTYNQDQFSGNARIIGNSSSQSPEEENCVDQPFLHFLFAWYVSDFRFGGESPTLANASSAIAEKPEEISLTGTLDHDSRTATPTGLIARCLVNKAQLERNSRHASLDKHRRKRQAHSREMWWKDALRAFSTSDSGTAPLRPYQATGFLFRKQNTTLPIFCILLVLSAYCRLFQGFVFFLKTMSYKKTLCASFSFCFLFSLNDFEIINNAIIQRGWIFELSSSLPHAVILEFLMVFS